MNIFGFRPFKGRFNLGNSDDIPTNQDGTLIGAVKRINSDLSAIKIDPLKVKVKYLNRYTVYTYGRAVLLDTFTSDNYLYVLPYTILENTSITLAVARFDETGLTVHMANSSSSNVDVPLFILYQEK